MSKIYNSTPNPKTNLSPNEIIFGQKYDFLDLNLSTKGHSSLENHKRMTKAIEVSQHQPCIGEILCQVVENDHYILPPFINLNFPIDRIIYDQKLAYQPLLPINCLPIAKLTTRIDISREVGERFGYNDATFMESAFLAIGAILNFYGIQKQYTTLDIRQIISKEVKKPTVS